MGCSWNRRSNSSANEGGTTYGLFFFQAEDGIRDIGVTGVQTCALPIFRGLERLAWAREECRALEEASDERDLDTVFARLPRIGGLDPSIRAVARELVEWREETARRQDRPIPSILGDAPLVEIARRRPKDLNRLEQIRGLNEQTLRRRGKEILAEI